jgi:hypothetical protein
MNIYHLTRLSMEDTKKPADDHVVEAEKPAVEPKK